MPGALAPITTGPFVTTCLGIMPGPSPLLSPDTVTATPAMSAPPWIRHDGLRTVATIRPYMTAWSAGGSSALSSSASLRMSAAVRASMSKVDADQHVQCGPSQKRRHCGQNFRLRWFHDFGAFRFLHARLMGERAHRHVVERRVCASCGKLSRACLKGDSLFVPAKVNCPTWCGQWETKWVTKANDTTTKSKHCKFWVSSCTDSGR